MVEIDDAINYLIKHIDFESNTFYYDEDVCIRITIERYMNLITTTDTLDKFKQELDKRKGEYESTRTS